VHGEWSTSPPDNTFALPTEVFSSCLAIVSAVTVGGLFLWPALRYGTGYQTVWETRPSAGTPSDVHWRRFYFQLTCVHSALELSGWCALQIYLLTYLLTDVTVFTGHNDICVDGEHSPRTMKLHDTSLRTPIQVAVTHVIFNIHSQRHWQCPKTALSNRIFPLTRFSADTSLTFGQVPDVSLTTLSNSPSFSVFSDKCSACV